MKTAKLKVVSDREFEARVSAEQPNVRWVQIRLNGSEKTIEGITWRENSLSELTLVPVTSVEQFFNKKEPK